MGSKNIIGREKELNILKGLYESNQSKLVIVSGRRRVGKTFLIDEAFKGDFVFKLTGSRNQPTSIQLRNFIAELERRTKKESKKIYDWIGAFELLRDYLDSLDESKRIVVFFDEFPWLDNRKSGFLSAFEFFWNDYGSSKNNLLFIICGSSTSWIENKILKNKGGLFDRHSAILKLKPFTLKETELFLKDRNINWERIDIVRLYMVLGGIPYYLNYLDNNLTLNENVDNLFFNDDALLKDEFNQLYLTLFERAEGHIKVVTALSTVKSGLTRKEIADITKLSYNGALSEILESLEVSGFIMSYDRYGDKKETCYMLMDYFSLFYLRFLKDKHGIDHHYWSNSYESSSKRVYEGLTFERVCLTHIDNIKDALSIGGVLSTQYPWLKKGNDEESGAQVDLVIDRRDSVITICEMKFSNAPYLIDKEYSINLRNKIDVFRRSMKTKKTIQLVFITTFGIKQSLYNNMINRFIDLDAFFK